MLCIKRSKCSKYKLFCQVCLGKKINTIQNWHKNVTLSPCSRFLAGVQSSSRQSGSVMFGAAHILKVGQDMHWQDGISASAGSCEADQRGDDTLRALRHSDVEASSACRQVGYALVFHIKSMALHPCSLPDSPVWVHTVHLRDAKCAHAAPPSRKVTSALWLFGRVLQQHRKPCFWDYIYWNHPTLPVTWQELDRLRSDAALFFSFLPDIVQRAEWTEEWYHNLTSFSQPPAAFLLRKLIYGKSRWKLIDWGNKWVLSCVFVIHLGSVCVLQRRCARSCGRKELPLDRSDVISLHSQTVVPLFTINGWAYCLLRYGSSIFYRPGSMHRGCMMQVNMPCKLEMCLILSVYCPTVNASHSGLNEWAGLKAAQWLVVEDEILLWGRYQSPRSFMPKFPVNFRSIKTADEALWEMCPCKVGLWDAAIYLRFS